MNYELMIEQIKQHEGLRLKPYKCSEGYLTIGYGRNLETNGIEPEEAEELLLNDLSDVEENLNSIHLLEDHNDARQAVLINMCFQLGFAGLMRFTRTLRLLKEFEYEKASVEMLNSRWAKQTPARAKELSEQMRTGEFL
jgi:lysozyme